MSGVIFTEVITGGLTIVAIATLLVLHTHVALIYSSELENPGLTGNCVGSVAGLLEILNKFSDSEEKLESAD